MRLIVLGVVLAVMQAHVPVPRQTADKDANSSQAVNDKNKGGSKVPGKPSAAVEAFADAHSAGDTQQPSNGDTEKPVVIRKLVPVATTPTWTDKAMVWVNLAMVLAVGIQAWLLCRTMKVIQRQAEIMTQQTAIARRSAFAAKASADALINSERAWLLIRPHRTFRLGPSTRLDWQIRNVGRTTAEITETRVNCRKVPFMQDWPPVPEYAGTPIDVPRIPIAPEDSMDFWSYIEKDTRNYDGLVATDVDDIRNSRADLTLHGFAKYVDSFGRPHESRFCYRYQTAFQEFRTDLTAPSEYHRCT